MWPTATAMGENTSNEISGAPQGATSAPRKHGEQICAALMSPPCGACPNTMGPVPTAHAVGYILPPATRANQGTRGGPCHVWLRPAAALRYYWLGESNSLMARRESTFRKQHLSAEYGYIVIYERLLEGGYQVIVPALPGIVTYGRTLEEAREMAEDAIRCHLRALLKDGEDIQSTWSRASSAKQV